MDLVNRDKNQGMEVKDKFYSITLFVIILLYYIIYWTIH